MSGLDVEMGVEETMPAVTTCLPLKTQPRTGDRGCFFLFDLQQKPGSLASTLEVRGLLEQEPDIAAKQELVVVCVSDSIMNIGYQAPSETPVLTEIQPVIGA